MLVQMGGPTSKRRSGNSFTGACSLPGDFPCPDNAHVDRPRRANASQRSGPLRVRRANLHISSTTRVFRRSHPEWDEGLHRLLSSSHAYFARFQTTVAVPPPDAAAAVYRSWSPLMVNGRFCSVPLQLGNVAVSILKVKVLSAALTDKVPKWVRLPPTVALFSSAVAVVRLLEATLGRSAREKAIT